MSGFDIDADDDVDADDKVGAGDDRMGVMRIASNLRDRKGV